MWDKDPSIKQRWTQKSTSAGQAYLALRAISVQRLSNNNVLAVQAAFNPDAPSIASGNLTGYC